jgi:hypothetical protein
VLVEWADGPLPPDLLDEEDREKPNPPDLELLDLELGPLDRLELERLELERLELERLELE